MSKTGWTDGVGRSQSGLYYSAENLEWQSFWWSLTILSSHTHFKISRSSKLLINSL